MDVCLTRHTWSRGTRPGAWAVATGLRQHIPKTRHCPGKVGGSLSTDLLCSHCHQPQAAHLRLAMAKGFDWDFVLVCPSGTWQAPQEANPQNVEKNPQRKDYGVYSPEVERDLSERYTTEAADVGVTAIEDLSAQATDAMNAGDYVRATHLWIRKVDTVYRELKQAEVALMGFLAMARRERDVAIQLREHERQRIAGLEATLRRIVVTDSLEGMLKQIVEDRNASVQARDKAEAERDRARDQLAGCCACQHDGRGALTSECQEHQEQREALAVLRTALARLVWRWKNGHSIGSISDGCADELDRLLKEK